MDEYVLTLVVRVEKSARPGQTEALETAARAVLAILADERSAGEGSTGEGSTGEGSAGDGSAGEGSAGEGSAGEGSAGEGEWAGAMAAWQDARIRKVVRRARGAEWRRAEALPGITVTGSDAEVRVFPPAPLDAVPKELAKLQVTGTDFEDPDDLAVPVPGIPVLWINPGLTMSSGKAMAQCGHAAHLAWLALSAAGRKEWVAADFALAVRTATHARWRELLTSGLPVVQDAGFTEVAPGSRTVIADHPLLTR